MRDYSTISEKLPPAEVVDLLNEYFGAMSEVIDRQGGCVIEFLGDAILAVFGAPGELPDHAERAVRAALQMQRRGAELNLAWERNGKASLWKERGIPALASRIGVHTGRVVAGNLGSKTRMKYAVIGDTVNAASRVEHLNNTLGTDLLFTEEVRIRLPPELVALARDAGEHPVKGRGARMTRSRTSARTHDRVRLDAVDPGHARDSQGVDELVGPGRVHRRAGALEDDPAGPQEAVHFLDDEVIPARGSREPLGREERCVRRMDEGLAQDDLGAGPGRRLRRAGNDRNDGGD